MLVAFMSEFSGRSVAGVCGAIAGVVITWTLARWKRRQERQSILTGDARDTIVIAQHIVDVQTVPTEDGTGMQTVARSLRIRSLGQGELNHVVPNGHLAEVFAKRALHVTPQNTLISMDGAEGSYLLETLTNFVCDRVGNEPFEHDVYVMAPCCEPAELAQHQPITIILITREDLRLFEEWETCRDVEVEHTSDGARVLTLMSMARQFQAEEQELVRRRKSGLPTRYSETMYLLDLALDRREAAIPIRPVPWERYTDLLNSLHLRQPDRKAEWQAMTV